MQYNELDRANAIRERWVAIRPEPGIWVKWGKFEEERWKLDKAREVFLVSYGFRCFYKYAELEKQLECFAHVRAIYELGFDADPIPAPRAMREEAKGEEEDVPMVEGEPVRARQVFERGYKDLKSKGSKHERVVLLEIWKPLMNSEPRRL
ncbi:hypothetical protein ACG7TL_001779 [Trametes sanguinea]